MLLVAAGLIYRDAKLLITQRPHGKIGALKWEFPGGKVEEDEDPKDCLKREVREELGIDISVGGIVEVIFHRYPEYSVLLLFYMCDWISGEAHAYECNAFEWINPRNLLRYDFLEADRDLIHNLASENLS